MAQAPVFAGVTNTQTPAVESLWLGEAGASLSRRTGLLLGSVAASECVRHARAASLTASMLARILCWLAEARPLEPPGAHEIAHRDQPDENHDHIGNPGETNHGPPPP